MPVAFTEIRHGEDDGNVIIIEEGEEVRGLPKEVVDQLKEDGIIGDEPEKSEDEDDDAEKESLKAEVEELKKQLAAASSSSRIATAEKAPQK